MTSGCRACRADLEHCHGTFIHHAYRGSECTEDGCAAIDGDHALHIDCAAVGCACAPPETGAVSAHRVS